jgi:hypothetical protein
MQKKETTICKIQKMIELERIIKSMDFDFFGKGEHKIDIESFLKKENSVL